MIGKASSKYILLTGGSSGIGLELVRRWAPRHSVLVASRTLSPELKSEMGRFPLLSHVAADFADPETACRAIMARMQDLGWERLDHAVLNAGTGSVGDPAQESPSGIAQTVDTNMTSPMRLAHALYPHLGRARGTLTLIGSTAHRGASRFASYAASKAGLNGFARALREEWRGRITVQVLHPGPTRTGMHAKAGFDPGLMRALFVSPPAMAAMIDAAIARGTPRRTISFMRYWAGDSLLARGIR